MVSVCLQDMFLMYNINTCHLKVNVQIESNNNQNHNSISTSNDSNNNKTQRKTKTTVRRVTSKIIHKPHNPHIMFYKKYQKS